MPLAPAVSELARRTMNVAFEELERTVTPADSRAFRSATLEHVRIEALDIEKQLASTTLESSMFFAMAHRFCPGYGHQ